MCATCGCDSTDHHHDHDHHDHDHHDHDHHDHDHHDHEHRREPATSRTLRIEQDILAKNDEMAARNRAWFAGRGVLALNVTSAPGSGKTTLFESIIGRMRDSVDIAVIEGDQETERDADRIRRTGCRAVQINTGAGCHLDAKMVEKGLRALDPPAGSLLLIENVGNLVCPALFDLGEQSMMVVMSVTEGEDKPLKYPHMFREADAIVIGKTDLLPHLRFDLERCLGYVRDVNPRAQVFLVSATTGQGLDELCAWIGRQLRSEAAARTAS
jgi:hydrogenase nickel incorporation protein HypB